MVLEYASTVWGPYSHTVTHTEDRDCIKKGSKFSVVRHLPLVLEVPGSIPLAARKFLVSEHAFSSVICRDDAR